ncbi:UNKNOWN [Stylonychia lemnae]|uniref:Uncharacterized protein n=1 Tax=Stylonychia lemnae TaxID=5949 RepID=A0A078B8U3_STYLE|nr:UNKNOWN [Stylonychia lemnae]|eukprot:CDW90646.1 UNKNOWN [Stylonychia lemnae]
MNEKIKAVIENKKQNTFWKAISKHIKSADKFGHPIQLKYKNRSTYNTLFGGIITLIARLGIFIYFLLAIIDVTQKKSFVKNSLVIRDLALDETEFKIDTDNFDIAVQLKYSVNDPKVQNNLGAYAYVSVNKYSMQYIMNNGSLTYNLKIDRLNLSNNIDSFISFIVPCEANRFLGEKEQTKKLGITNYFYCPKTINATLKGSLSSSSSKFITVSVH